MESIAVIIIYKYIVFLACTAEFTAHIHSRPEHGLLVLQNLLLLRPTADGKLVALICFVLV